MIKVVIFDIVGLLTNQEALSKGLERDHGITLEKSLPFFKGPLQDCVAGKADVKEVIIPYLDAWGWNKGVEAMLDYWFKRDHKINTELVSYINALRDKGVLCLMATNNEKYRFAYMLSEMGFDKVFDKAYCSAHLGCKKPNCEFFSKIYEDLENIKKEEILFWDDKLENINGAKSFGINAELWTSTEDFKEKMKQYFTI